MHRENLEDLKAACTSNQQRNNASSSLDEALHLIREDMADVKNLLGSTQQQNNASGISKKDLEDLKVACASDQQQCSQTELSKQPLVSALLCEYITCVRHFRRDMACTTCRLVSAEC